MNESPWHLRRGAVWKQTAKGSRIYIPSSCRAIPLDEAATHLLAELRHNRCPESLPEVLVDLVRDGVLTQRADEGQPLVMNQAEPGLDYVVLRLTNACNLRCRHCFVASSKPKPGELSLTEISRLFDSLENHFCAMTFSTSQSWLLSTTWLWTFLPTVHYWTPHT